MAEIQLETPVFEHLTQALYDYGEQVREMYRRNLLAADAKASGKLIDNIEVLVAYKGLDYVVYLKLEDYWKYVESGVQPAGKYGNPGWRAFPHILDWIQVKPSFNGKYRLPGAKTGDKKLPTAKQLAYLITRKIVNKGIAPRGFLADSIEAVNRYYMKELQEAIQQDFDAYAIYVLNQAGKLVRI